MSQTLSERVTEYLKDFPHRDDDMSKYGVCRDWLEKVLLKEQALNSPPSECISTHASKKARELVEEFGTAMYDSGTWGGSFADYEKPISRSSTARMTLLDYIARLEQGKE